jgi:mutator protein MutT
MEHPLTLFSHCPKCGSTEFEIINEKAKRCTACGFEYYFNPSAATVALIVNKQRELLVCRRAKDPAKGMLDLPGGFIDMFETAEEGVAREVMEETGLKVVKADYLFSLPNIYPFKGFDVHSLDMFFRCEVEDFSHINPMDDVKSTAFIPIDELNPELFGLQSIRKGVKKLIEENLLHSIQ